MEKPDVIVCQWSVSLYDEKARKWNFGTISMKPDQIEFLSDSEGKTSERMVIQFEDVIDIKKATTGLVFGAVYVVTKENKKIWFSSLMDRNGFHGTLSHFWKARLFQRRGDEGSLVLGGGRKTRLGQTLVGIVQDSQDTLSKAAVQLHGQGRQIDSSLWAMSELHNDLDIAERLVTDLESWVGRWRLPKQYSSADPVVVNKCDIPEVFETEIVYNKLETGKANPKIVGLLRLCRDGLYIMSQRQTLIHHFKWADVSKIRVVMPYEVMVIQYQLGKPDLVYGFVCADMIAILKLIEKCAKYKLEYDKPPETAVCTNHGSRVQARQIGTTKQENKGSFSERNANQDTRFPSFDVSSTPQLQVQGQGQTVSEQEVEQICQGLTSLKSLALAVEEEEGVQNEKLDTLTTSVDRANDRLTAVNKRVKHMT